MNVDCNACGSSLGVSETTRFVTCGKCKARLAIKRSEGAIYTEVLAEPSHDEKAEAIAPSGAGVALAPAPAATGGGESLLRVVMGVGLVASDVYWWMTDPSLQSRYIRVALLGAGGWLILSGIWRMIAHARARHASSPRVP